MAEEGTPPQLAELEAELRSMKPGARRKRAVAVQSFDPSASLKCAPRVEQIVESDSEAGDIFARMQAVMFAKL